MSGWGPKTGSSSGGGGGGGGLGNPDLPESILNVYNEISGIPAGPETTIISYLVAGSTPVHLIRCDFGGENIAQYRLYIDNALQARHATWFSGPFFSTWSFDGNDQGLSLNPGQVIKVTAAHYRPAIADFWTRLTLLRIDA